MCIRELVPLLKNSKELEEVFNRVIYFEEPCYKQGSSGIIRISVELFKNILLLF